MNSETNETAQIPMEKVTTWLAGWQISQREKRPGTTYGYSIGFDINTPQVLTSEILEALMAFLTVEKKEHMPLTWNTIVQLVVFHVSPARGGYEMPEEIRDQIRCLLANSAKITNQQISIGNHCPWPGHSYDIVLSNELTQLFNKVAEISLPDPAAIWENEGIQKLLREFGMTNKFEVEQIPFEITNLMMDLFEVPRERHLHINAFCQEKYQLLMTLIETGCQLTQLSVYEREYIITRAEPWRITW